VFHGKDFKVVDPKLRLSVPSKFRKMAEAGEEVDGFYLALGGGPFLKVYTRSEWKRIARTLSQLRGREDFDALQRDFLADVEYSPIDKQGRIVLTRDHFEAIGESAEVAVIGSGDHLEIWPRDVWENYRREKVDGKKAELWKELNRTREGDS
jgi:MraZ protein